MAEEDQPLNTEPAIDALVDTEGPQGLLRVMLAKRETRDQRLIETLEMTAAREVNNAALADRLIEIARWVGTVHAQANAFTLVHDRETLVAWYARSRISFLHGFSSLL